MSRLGSSSQSINQTTTNNFAGMTPEEQKLADKMSELGMSQADAVKYIMDATRGGGQVSSLALTPQDQAQLDAAYGGAEANLRRFGNIMGQDLAGTRGLNPSDTPVSEAVLRETLPAFQQLMSQKAQQGLGLGMNMRGFNEQARQFNLQAMLGGATSTPNALGFNLNRMQGERMARNTSTTSGKMYQNDSIMSQIGQGAAAYKDMMTGTASMFSGGKESGAAGVGAMMSDQRLKRDIRPVAWHWKTGGQEQLGVIAQDVQRSHPHLVHADEDGLLSVDYGALTAMLLSEREALYARLEALEHA